MPGYTDDKKFISRRYNQALKKEKPTNAHWRKTLVGKRLVAITNKTNDKIFKVSDCYEKQYMSRCSTGKREIKKPG